MRIDAPAILSLSNAESLQTCSVWNNTQVLPDGECIHRLFEKQVEHTPDAIAVRFGESQLTYQQLNGRANQLAHHLRSRGVGPEVLVGVYMERCLEMVVALLGILKAGGAYVPLDPSHPADRLAFVLQDTQVGIILTQQHLAPRLMEQTARVICLDSDWASIACQSGENSTSETTPDNLAYVIYTSGSTGQPKGVMVCHASVCNQLFWRQTTFALTPDDRVLQSISISFDPSVWQIFWCLCSGAQLVLATPQGHQDSAYLIQTILDYQISVVALVPSMLRLLLEEARFPRCDCLRYIFCGGEALTGDLQKRFFARCDRDNVLYNVYGPTEATIDATFWACDRNRIYPVAPIGHPITNAQIHILDENLQPVPVGKPGELHIGGAGLARGYLNRPDLTDKKFIPNPYSSNPMARLYKTGDLARCLPDGTIEFLGRIDNQVKLRGFRIELDEIEAVLGQHPAVRSTAVLVRETEGISRFQQLVAYVVPNPEFVNSAEPAIPFEPQAHALVPYIRQFLQEKLPDYMVPAIFVMLETMPLNANGKIDRRALPAPKRLPSNSEKPPVLPQDEIERALVQIWEQVLGIPTVSIGENFFELGGNSLLAVSLLSQIEQRFGRRLALQTFLQAPTIAHLATCLRTPNRSDEPSQTLIQLKAGGSKPPLFCIYGIMLYHRLAMALDPEQPVYGVYIQEEVDWLQKGEAAQGSTSVSVTDLASRYLEEIRAFQPSGPYYLAGASFGGLVAFEMAQQLQAQGEKVNLLALFDSACPGGEQSLSMRQRMALHLRQLAKEKHAYFAARLAHRMQKSQKALMELLGSLFGKRLLEESAQPGYLQQMAQRARREQVIRRAGESYQPLPYASKLTLFRAIDQNPFELYYTDAQAWAPYTPNGLEIYDVPGDHLGIFQEPHVQVLAEKLQVCLNAAQKEKPGLEVVPSLHSAA